MSFNPVGTSGNFNLDIHHNPKLNPLPLPIAGAGPHHEQPAHLNAHPHGGGEPNAPPPPRVVVRGGRSYQVVGNDNHGRKCFAWAAFILLCICTLGLALISYQALTGWANGRCR